MVAPPVGPRAGSAPVDGTNRRIIFSALAFGFGARVIATWVPLPGAWGLDTFRHQPPGWSMALAVLGALGFLPGVGNAIESALDRLGSMWERGGLRFDAFVAVAVGVALFSLRDSTRFVGDADARFAQLFTNAPSARVFPQATALDRIVNLEIPRALHGLGFPAADAAQAVPTLIGSMLVLLLFGFARSAGARRGDLPGVAALLLGSAIPLHMAGYGKFGLMLVGIALGGLGAVLMAREGRGAIVVGIGAALAVLGHRSGYLLLPAALVVFLQGWRTATSPAERRQIAAGAALSLGAAAIELPHALASWWGFDRGAHLSAVFSTTRGGGPLAGAWTALQTLFFVLPAWVGGIAASFALLVRPGPRTGGRFGLGPVVWTAGAAIGLQLLLVRGLQGEARDWDVQVGPALVLGLVSSYALIALAGSGMRRVTAPLASSALACAIALWSLHANPAVSYARIGSLLDQPALWPESARARAYDLLGMRALSQNAPVVAIRFLRAAIAIAPNPRYISELGGALRLTGHPAEASACYEDARRRDPSKADPWIGLGALALDRRDFGAALECARRARALEPHRTDVGELERLALQGSDGRGAPAR